MRLRRRGAEDRRCTRLIVLVNDGWWYLYALVVCGCHSVLIERGVFDRAMSGSVVYSDSARQWRVFFNCSVL
jgi:hypothetical protein